MVKKMLEELKIPSPLEIGSKRVQTVDEWKKIRPLVLKSMLENEYGYLPEEPENVEFSIIDSECGRFCGGKANYLTLEAACTVYGEKFVVIDGNGTVLRKTGVEPKITVIRGLTISKMNVGEPIETEESVLLRQKCSGLWNSVICTSRKSNFQRCRSAPMWMTV